MEVDELFDLKRSLETIIAIVNFLSRGEETEQGEIRHYYPALYNLADGVATFPLLVQRISQIIDKLVRCVITPHPNYSKYVVNLPVSKGVYHEHYTEYYVLHKEKDWLRRMSRLRCVTEDWLFLSHQA